MQATDEPKMTMCRGNAIGRASNSFGITLGRGEEWNGMQKTKLGGSSGPSKVRPKLLHILFLHTNARFTNYADRPLEEN
jgi:hypothetical protein